MKYIRGQMDAGLWSATFSLGGLAVRREATIEIISETFIPKETFKGSTDSRTLGVTVRDIRVLESD